jgi:hypothetical protein
VTQTEIQAAIRTDALVRLGVLAAEETPSAADDATAAAALSRVVDDLGARGEVWFTADALPEETRAALTLVVAADLADAFGLSEERLRRLLAEAQEARRALRGMGRALSTGPVAFINY